MIYQVTPRGLYLKNQRTYLTDTNFRDSESMLHIFFSAELSKIKMPLILFEAYLNAIYFFFFSTSRTLFERDGWLPSQAKPAGDAPAPRVGALTLLLLLQHLVPEVLVRGAAAGPLPLGKQIWECEGLPVCQLHVGHLIVWLLYPDVPVFCQNFPPCPIRFGWHYMSWLIVSLS